MLPEVEPVHALEDDDVPLQRDVTLLFIRMRIQTFDIMEGISQCVNGNFTWLVDSNIRGWVFMMAKVLCALF